MKKLLEKLKLGLFDHFDLQLIDTLQKIQIIKSRKLIRRELLSSKETGRTIGIYSPVLGEGMFLTGVDDIITLEQDEIVVLKPYDMNGILLHRNHIALSEIRSVCPFESFYINPLIKDEKELVLR